VTVDDPFGVASDPVLTTLAAATDPPSVQRILERGVDGLAPPGAAELRAIRVIRYKPVRRCLIEYDLLIDASGRNGPLTAIGKVRRNRPGRHQLRLQQALWAAGFDEASTDGISVPEPLGEIPELHMWLQRKVDGVPATELLGGDRGALAARLVDVADKIHRAGIPSRKRHTMHEELRILESSLRTVARARPALASELELMLGQCARAAATVTPTGPTGIHRDFYPDQVLADGDRLHVVDFDLYTRGDPVLDVGNLVGHVTEQSLREFGDVDGLLDVEEAAEDRAEALMGPPARHAARVYGALTLARHVFLASERSERDHLVEEIADATRARLARIAA
jgi:hypothetical protein